MYPLYIYDIRRFKEEISGLKKSWMLIDMSEIVILMGS